MSSAKPAKVHTNGGELLQNVPPEFAQPVIRPQSIELVADPTPVWPGAKKVTVCARMKMKPPGPEKPVMFVVVFVWLPPASNLTHVTVPVPSSSTTTKSWPGTPFKDCTLGERLLVRKMKKFEVPKIGDSSKFPTTVSDVVATGFILHGASAPGKELIISRFYSIVNFGLGGFGFGGATRGVSRTSFFSIRTSRIEFFRKYRSTIRRPVNIFSMSRF